MVFVDMLFAFLVAVFLSAIFAVGFRRRGPWTDFIAFFTIVFLAAWAGGVWATPVGRSVWGVYWLPFLFVGFVIALLLAASPRVGPPRSRSETVVRGGGREKVEIAFGVFFWILIVTLGVSIFVRYL